MTTALDIIKIAMQEIGALGLNEAPSSDEAANCLDALNDLISQNNNENTVIYTIEQNTYPIVANQMNYTFGVGGTTSTTRFDSLEKIIVRNSTNVDFLVEILTFDEYSDIVTKQITSSFPFAAYDDRAYPIRTLTMYPIPTDASYNLILWTGKKIPLFSDLTDVLIAADEYNRFYKTNLAIEIASRFGREPSLSLIKRAEDAKTIVERNNFVPRELSMPDFGGKRGNVLGEYLGAMM